MYATPRFYFTDFNICLQWGNGRENYIGDLEIKWLKTDSSKPAIFPFNKLQQMLIAPPYTDSEHSYHRICFRFSDGIAMVPARELAHIEPVFHTRWDTQERDLVIFYDARSRPEYWHNLVINEQISDSKGKTGRKQKRTPLPISDQVEGSLFIQLLLSAFSKLWR